MLESWAAWTAVLKRIDPAYEIPDPSKLSQQKLVKTLREIVGYARDTFNSQFAPDDEQKDAPADLEDRPDQAMVAGTPDASEQAPAF